MKSPKKLAEKLARQWHNPNTRTQRLLTHTCWPIRLPISKPSAEDMQQRLETVRAHLQRWRAVSIGTVHWESIPYRSTSNPIDIPIFWQLNQPSDWIAATQDENIQFEFQKLAKIISAVNPLFHTLLVRQHYITTEKPEAEIIQACALAMLLEPGCAQGSPLRTLSLAGIDSKFFERHQRLLIKLLDLRFEGLASELGLEGFLDALNEGEHWLLIADLDGQCLPFKQCRVRSSELKKTMLPAKHILIVENERCLHLLPKLPDTIGILGAGLNLAWMHADWLRKKRIAYWGDIDTWGLTMLARARLLQPALKALLMTETLYEQYGPAHAVPEPKTAGDAIPPGLTEEENIFYLRLLKEEKGRVEQEFLPKKIVEKVVVMWNGACDMATLNRTHKVD